VKFRNAEHTPLCIDPGYPIKECTNPDNSKNKSAVGDFTRNAFVLLT